MTRKKDEEFLRLDYRKPNDVCINIPWLYVGVNEFGSHKIIQNLHVNDYDDLVECLTSVGEIESENESVRKIRKCTDLRCRQLFGIIK